MPRKKHGMDGTSVYRAWISLKARCNNRKDKDYYKYGGRGISVCDRWQKSFENFYKDMGNKPTPNHSIDRINNNGNYEPSNCRWATARQQRVNRRTSNKTGVPGVYPVTRHYRYVHYRVCIYVGSRSKHIGMFKSLNEAKLARAEAERLYWNDSYA